MIKIMKVMMKMMKKILQNNKIIFKIYYIMKITLINE